MTIAQANGLLGLLASGSGLVHITGSVGPNIETTKNETTGEQEVSFDALVSGSSDGQLHLTFDTETTRNAVLTGADKPISGGWKAVQTTSGNASVADNSTLAVYGANNGNYAQDKDGNVVGLQVGSGSTLKLNNEGKVAELNGTDGTVQFESGSVVSVVDKDGKLGNIDVGNMTGAGAVSAGNIKSTNIDMSNGGAVTAESIKIADTAKLTGAKFTAQTISAESFVLDQQASVNTTGESGSVTATSITMTGGSELNAKTIEVKEFRVGADKTDTSAGGTANVVADVIDLQDGGYLIIDPEFNQQTATVFAKTVGSIVSNEMKINGHLVVGKNSALGIGGEESAFREALAKYQTNGSLSNDYGAYVYINTANVNLNNHKLVIGAEESSKLKSYLQNGAADIYLGTDSALQVSAKALQDADKSAVFTGLGSNSLIESTDGTLIVPANMSSSQIAKIFGTEIDLESGSKIIVTTENGLYTGVIDSADDLHDKGDFSLTLAGNARNILSGLSNPTYEYVTNVMSHESAHHTDEAAFNEAVKNKANAGTNGTQTATTTTPAYGTNGVAILDDSFGYQFLQDALGSTNSHAVEQGARLASFGGAVQALQVASSSTTDAVNSRLGMGNGAARLTIADNAQNAALWVAPVYRNFSSDSFEANGLGYGADVDLFGAALGADYTLENGLRIGAMFNVGSGDADGNGAGAGVSNDFSYYGLGIYAGFSPVENLSLTADVSYTVVDNDLESNTGILDYGKFNASTDATAWSVGIGAQYVYKSTIDVAPHIGLRYTNLDVDNYDVKIDGLTVARTSGDSAGVFSIPVGVSLSKDITSGAWTVRPAADFTVNFNFGDDELTSTTAFDGILGDAIQYNTEFGDTVSYGATFGVGASNGNLSFGINAGFNKSSNTDDYTVGANTRFVF